MDCDNATVALQAWEHRTLPATSIVIGTIGDGALHLTATGGDGRVLVLGSQVANESQDAAGFEMAFRDELINGSGVPDRPARRVRKVPPVGRVRQVRKVPWARRALQGQSARPVRQGQWVRQGQRVPQDRSVSTGAVPGAVPLPTPRTMASKRRVPRLSRLRRTRMSRQGAVQAGNFSRSRSHAALRLAALLPPLLPADRPDRRHTDWGTFTQWYDTRAIAGYAFVALLVWWIRRSARDEARKPVAFGLIWFAVALIPTSSFPLAEVANEHRVFFAFIGLVLAATTWTAVWSETHAGWRNAFAACAVAVLLANAIGTYERNEVWRSEETLWADVVVKSPMNGRAWMNFGLTRMARGRYAEAKAAFDRAAVYTPRYSYLEINQGIVEGELGHSPEAERHFRNALAMTPDANAHFFFARWLVRVGRAPEALDHLKEAVRQSAAAPAPRALLLRLDDARGAEAETRALLEETRGLDPSEPSVVEVTRTWPSYAAAFAGGLAAIQRQDWPAAVHASRDALRHDPQSADAYNNLGWALAQLGFRKEAAEAYRAALTRNPSHERARNNLQLVSATPST